MENNYVFFSDKDLFLLVKDDCEEAYTEIYNRYKVVLFIHAYKFIQNEEEVKDILQELFTALWIKRKEIELRGSVSSYLYTSIKNRVLDRIAHTQVANKYIESIKDYIDKGEYITDEALRERELRLIIEKGVEDMPLRMKEVYELSRNQDLSYKQIAQKLDISENTVRKQIYNALRLLRLRINTILLLLFP